MPPYMIVHFYSELALLFSSGIFTVEKLQTMTMNNEMLGNTIVLILPAGSTCIYMGFKYLCILPFMALTM